jgi:hypothetical protein
LPQKVRRAAVHPSPEQRPSAQFEHAAPTLTHSLLASHTWGCEALQRRLPGRHRQWPAWQTGVAPEHALWLCHVPSSEHTRGALPEQLRVPGVHSPAHSPAPVHTKEHAVGVVPHVPEVLHTTNPVLGVSGTHCLADGTHCPAQAPFTHAYGHWLAASH